MAQVINTNMASLNAQRHLSASQGELGTSMERLSSGLRINSAKDDAAGLAIGNRFTAQINGLNQGARNANDGISFAQTAEGAMEEMGNLLQRIRELAVQAANDTNTASDRRALDAEVQQAVMEIDRISRSTQFNGQNILDGTMRELVFQVGANRAQTINVTGVDVRGEVLGAEVLDGYTVSRELDENGEYTDLDVNSIMVNGVEVSLAGTREVADVVNALNAATTGTGVQAFRADLAETDVITFSNPGDREGMLLINGYEIGFSGSEDNAAALQNFLDEVNRESARTGVRAEQAGDNGFRLVSDADFVLENTAPDRSPIGNAEILGPNGATRFERGIQLVNDVGRPVILTEGADLAALGLQNREGDALQAERYTVSGQWALDVRGRESASNAIRTVDFALGQINAVRADLGAVQNRFESTVSNLQNISENMSATRSRIMDADFAEETSNMTRTQILQQAGTSMLAQANQVPQNVLTLLQ